jgi:hypothetical protein
MTQNNVREIIRGINTFGHQKDTGLSLIGLKQLYINRLDIPSELQDEIKSYCFETIESAKHKKSMRKICYKFRNAAASRLQWYRRTDDAKKKFGAGLEDGEFWSVNLTRKAKRFSNNNKKTRPPLRETNFLARNCKSCGEYMIYNTKDREFGISVHSLYKRKYSGKEMEDGIIKTYYKRLICQCGHHKK